MVASLNQKDGADTFVAEKTFKMRVTMDQPNKHVFVTKNKNKNKKNTFFDRNKTAPAQPASIP
jgi:hypothetical protein